LVEERGLVGEPALLVFVRLHHEGVAVLDDVEHLLPLGQVVVGLGRRRRRRGRHLAGGGRRGRRRGPRRVALRRRGARRRRAARQRGGGQAGDEEHDCTADPTHVPARIRDAPRRLTRALARTAVRGAAHAIWLDRGRGEAGGLDRRRGGEQ